MSELTDFMRSSDFIRPYTAIASSGPQKGVIFIEDASDRHFWERVVNSVCPGRYDIKPFTQKGAEGKRALEKEYAHLNKDRLVAVDSDYDYLCPDRNEFSAQIHTHPYVLHTFCYSRESFIHTPECIEYLTDSIHLHDKAYSQIQEALRGFSIIIYDALLVFSWLHNHDQQRFKESDFRESFRLPAGTRLLNDNLKVCEPILEQLRQSVQRYTETHSEYLDVHEGFSRHREALSVRGITPDSALLFINGHNLLDGIFRPVYELLIRTSRRKDNEWVENNCPANEKRDRKNQVRNHYEQNCNARQLIYRCESYTASPFWQKITHKLAEIETLD